MMERSKRKTRVAQRTTATVVYPSLPVIAPEVIASFLAHAIGERQDAYLASLAEMAARMHLLANQAEKTNENLKHQQISNAALESQMTDQVKEFKKMRSAVVRMTKYFELA